MAVEGKRRKTSHVVVELGSSRVKPTPGMVQAAEAREALNLAKMNAKDKKELHAELIAHHPMFKKVSDIKALLKNLKTLDGNVLKKHIADLDVALKDFQKSAQKDRAAFNILSAEFLTVLKNAKKEMSTLRDPMSVRVYNAFVGVIAAFLNLLDRFQAYVLSRPTIDRADRARFFAQKATPVQDVKDALQRFETTLKTMNKEINAVEKKATPAVKA